jgi:hypothetical protein
MRIPYAATNFPAGLAATLSSNPHITVTWTDLVWAAVTAGKPGSSYLLAHGWHSLADLVVRTHTVYANLRQRLHYCERSMLYDSLDPSEKSATSYFLGMTMAKLFAAQLFDTPWLFHVSLASSNGTLIKFKRGTKSQPDLIGQKANGDWIVIEAKGRTNGLDLVALGKAKDQTRMIRQINGVTPQLRIALQTYFDADLSVRLDDPEDSDPDSTDIELDLDAAFLRYYALASAVTKQTTDVREVRGRKYVTRFDLDSGITIGLETRILERIAQGNFQGVRAELKNFDAVGTETTGALSTYPDGLFIALDERWSPELMAREPEARRGG